MASRRYFGYDPCDYYYTSPYQYTYPYYHHPASARSAGGFFPVAGEDDQYLRYQRHPAIYRNAGGFFPATRDVDPYYQPAPARRARGFFPAAGNVEPPTACAAARPEAGAPSSLPIPVRFDRSDPDPQVARVPVKRAPSSDEAAVRLQAAARGFLARRAVRALIAVEREADEVAEKVAREAEALRGDARIRIAVGEALMRLLLRLDAVRGAREYRRRVTRRVLALQDTVDALEERPALGAEEVEDQAAETSTVETVAEENALATELLSAVEKNGVTETSVTMDVEGDRAAAEDAEPAPGGANLGDKSADENAEGGWEMVSEERAAAVPVDRHAPQTQGPAGAETTTRPAVAGGADGGVDTKKLMEMVAALCEQSAQSAQQCAMIGALAERVDALERTVRQVEDAERRRQRVKKLRKEGKGSNYIKCHSD